MTPSSTCNDYIRNYENIMPATQKQKKPRSPVKASGA
jgi:hypothetical protein